MFFVADDVPTETTALCNWQRLAGLDAPHLAASGVRTIGDRD